MHSLATLGIRSLDLEQVLRGALPKGKAEQAKVSALLDVIRESTRTEYQVDRPKINSPRVAMEFLRPKIAGLASEVFGILALDSKGHVIGDEVIAAGSCTAVIISPREVFRAALRMGAASIIVWHNHPSGDSTPSKEDANLTRRIRAAGDSLGIPLADHIVMAVDGGTSFRSLEGWDRA